MTPERLSKLIMAAGWYLVAIVGSHHQFKHAIKRGKVTIPFHKKPKDLPPKTVSSILKQAQIKKVGDNYVDAVSGDILCRA